MIESYDKKQEGEKVHLTIKDYNVPDGLSKQFKEKEPCLKNQSYEIKGPMGKGFNITKESKGVHMIFAAGTGILPFVDMIARLLLSTLEIIPSDQRFHDDFKLHVYVAYMSRAESVALDLLEMLE
jgi:hypothetical protein